MMEDWAQQADQPVTEVAIYIPTSKVIIKVQLSWNWIAEILSDLAKVKINSWATSVLQGIIDSIANMQWEY